jgi:heptosyltransferase I
MKVLVVKLSSLGDVVHTLPAVQDILRAQPAAQIDWVVEEGFADIAALCKGVQRVIPIALRRWRKQGLLSSRSHAEWASFKRELQREAYDVVFDFQGLVKSAAIARLAHIAPGGQRVGLANRTEGASYEPLARAAYTRAVRVTPHTHAIERSRKLVQAVWTESAYSHLYFGFASDLRSRLSKKMWSICVNALNTGGFAMFIHGTSRADKLWREASWVSLGITLAQRGLSVMLPWGSEAEHAAAERIAQGINAVALNKCIVLPKLKLAELTAVLAQSVLVVGVDSGLVHIASGLDRPTVQLYNFPTAWRTGGYWSERTVNVEAAGGPSDVAVMAAVQKVLP